MTSLVVIPHTDMGTLGGILSLLDGEQFERNKGGVGALFVLG